MSEFLKNITPREYQQKIFETCINKNCLVVLPTGLGKTLIALMLIIKRMQEYPGKKVVFLAPTKPLAEQHIISFKKYLPELFADMQLFTGAINSIERKKIWQTADIIFSTPQCVANDLRKELYSLKDVCLLIEDEAHRCAKNYDYNYIAKRYITQADNPRIMGLTASPGNEASKIKEICKNLSIEEVELRTRDSPDVKKYLQELEFEKIMVEFPIEFQEMKHVLLKLYDRYVEELRYRKVLFGPANKITLIKLQQTIMGTLARGNHHNYNYLLGASACAQAIKLQHALELLETQTLESFNKYLKTLFNQAAKKQSKGVVKLVANPEFNFIFMQSNELLAKKQEHPKLKEIEEIISKIFVGQAKKEGTGLSQKDQKKIIEDFSAGEINVLVATSIAEEGLDIPEVNAVIFYEPIPSAIRAIQRAGRTARLKKGKLIMLITKGTRDESFYYVSKAREKQMHSAIETVKQGLTNNIKEEVQKTL